MNIGARTGAHACVRLCAHVRVASARTRTYLRARACGCARACPTRIVRVLIYTPTQTFHAWVTVSVHTRPAACVLTRIAGVQGERVLSWG